MIMNCGKMFYKLIAYASRFRTRVTFVLFRKVVHLLVHLDICCIVTVVTSQALARNEL